MTMEEKKEIAKRIYKELGFETDNFQIERIEEINADIFFPIDNQRGIGGVIIGNDGSYHVCGSINPLQYYIDEFKNGIKDGISELNVDNQENDYITREEYDKMFETDENDAFVRLIIPANQPTSEYKEELNLIGKLPSDFTQDEVIRMKIYSREMHEKIRNDISGK